MTDLPIDTSTLVSLSSASPYYSTLCISATDGREIVRITAEGRVIVNPDFTIDEAARAFWDAVKELASKGEMNGKATV
jgi:hypothetical protein